MGTIKGLLVSPNSLLHALKLETLQNTRDVKKEIFRRYAFPPKRTGWNIWSKNCIFLLALLLFSWTRYIFPLLFPIWKEHWGCNPSLSGRPIVDLCHWDSAFIPPAASSGALNSFHTIPYTIPCHLYYHFFRYHHTRHYHSIPFRTVPNMIIPYLIM